MPLAEGFASKFAVRWAEPPFGRPAQSKDFRDYAFSLFPHWKLLSSFHAVTFEEDPDGVFRRAPLLFRYGNDWFPSLTLAGVMATVSGPTLKFSDGTLRVLGKGGEDIPGVYFAGSYQL